MFTITLGPAVDNDSSLARVLVSANRLRLNGSHLDPGSLGRWLDRLAGLWPEPGRAPEALVLDLQGSKMRIGCIEERAALPEKVEIVPAESSTGSPGTIPVPHPELFEAVTTGERLSIDDGAILLQIDGKSAFGLSARVLRNGPLSSRKGINRTEHPLRTGGLCANDLALVELCNGRTGKLPFSVEYALSFVLDGSEAKALRRLTGQRVIAKLERPEAFDSLSDIAGAFDELWFCRGDLGAQAGLHALARLQLRMEDRLHELSVPMHLAGKVLESMLYRPEAGRNDVFVLHQALERGWAGIVLSDETASGDHPQEVLDLVDDFRKSVSTMQEECDCGDGNA